MSNSLLPATLPQQSEDMPSQCGESSNSGQGQQAYIPLSIANSANTSHDTSEPLIATADILGDQGDADSVVPCSLDIPYDSQFDATEDLHQLMQYRVLTSDSNEASSVYEKNSTSLCGDDQYTDGTVHNDSKSNDKNNMNNKDSKNTNTNNSSSLNSMLNNDSVNTLYSETMNNDKTYGDIFNDDSFTGSGEILLKEGENSSSSKEHMLNMDKNSLDVDFTKPGEQDIATIAIEEALILDETTLVYNHAQEEHHADATLLLDTNGHLLDMKSNSIKNTSTLNMNDSTLLLDSLDEDAQSSPSTNKSHTDLQPTQQLYTNVTSQAQTNQPTPFQSPDKELQTQCYNSVGMYGYEAQTVKNQYKNMQVVQVSKIPQRFFSQDMAVDDDSDQSDSHDDTKNTDSNTNNKDSKNLNNNNEEHLITTPTTTSATTSTTTNITNITNSTHTMSDTMYDEAHTQALEGLLYSANNPGFMFTPSKSQIHSPKDKQGETEDLSEVICTLFNDTQSQDTDIDNTKAVITPTQRALKRRISKVSSVGQTEHPNHENSTNHNNNTRVFNNVEYTFEGHVSTQYAQDSTQSSSCLYETQVQRSSTSVKRKGITSTQKPALSEPDHSNHHIQQLLFLSQQIASQPTETDVYEDESRKRRKITAKAHSSLVAETLSLTKPAWITDIQFIILHQKAIDTLKQNQIDQSKFTDLLNSTGTIEAVKNLPEKIAEVLQTDVKKANLHVCEKQFVKMVQEHVRKEQVKESSLFDKIVKLSKTLEPSFFHYNTKEASVLGFICTCGICEKEQQELARLKKEAELALLAAAKAEEEALAAEEEAKRVREEERVRRKLELEQKKKEDAEKRRVTIEERRLAAEERKRILQEERRVAERLEAERLEAERLEAQQKLESAKRREDAQKELEDVRMCDSDDATKDITPITTTTELLVQIKENNVDLALFEYWAELKEYVLRSNNNNHITEERNVRPTRSSTRVKPVGQEDITQSSTNTVKSSTNTTKSNSTKNPNHSNHNSTMKSPEKLPPTRSPTKSPTKSPTTKPPNSVTTRRQSHVEESLPFSTPVSQLALEELYIRIVHCYFPILDDLSPLHEQSVFMRLREAEIPDLQHDVTSKQVELMLTNIDEKQKTKLEKFCKNVGFVHNALPSCVPVVSIRGGKQYWSVCKETIQQKSQLLLCKPNPPRTSKFLYCRAAKRIPWTEQQDSAYTVKNQLTKGNSVTHGVGFKNRLLSDFQFYILGRKTQEWAAVLQNAGAMVLNYNMAQPNNVHGHTVAYTESIVDLPYKELECHCEVCGCNKDTCDVCNQHEITNLMGGVMLSLCTRDTQKIKKLELITPSEIVKNVPVQCKICCKTTTPASKLNEQDVNFVPSIQKLNETQKDVSRAPGFSQHTKRGRVIMLVLPGQQTILHRCAVYNAILAQIPLVSTAWLAESISKGSMIPVTEVDYTWTYQE